jgi:hypothetical protein
MSLIVNMNKLPMYCLIYSPKITTSIPVMLLSCDLVIIDGVWIRVTNSHA